MNHPPPGEPAGDPGPAAPREPDPEPPHHGPQEPPGPHAPPEEGPSGPEEPPGPQEPQAPSGDPYAAPQGPPGGPHQPAAPHGEPADPRAPAYRPRHAPPREDGEDDPPGAAGPPPPAGGSASPLGARAPDAPGTGYPAPYGGSDPGAQEPYRPYLPFAPPGSTAAELGLRPAEWGRRLVARIIDGLVVIIPSFIVLFAVLIVWVVATGPGRPLPAGPFSAGAGENLLLDAVGALLVCALLVAYETWMLARWGATLGKMAMGLRIVPRHHPNGYGAHGAPGGPADTGLAGSTSLVRALVWWGPAGLNWLPVLGALIALFPLLNGLWPLWDRPDQQSLNDKAARTIVIRER
ncbi:RDD family protein [Nocardiopsis mangrovi]|uniref:RDD family protein n=1 Tax=Nocardiopsis mangrovi TaxID=1179818 RepID=A0ABV9DRH7_9ACTN